MLDDGALVSNSLVQSVQNLSKDILPTDLNVRRKNQVAVGLEIGSRATAQQDTVTYPEASVTLAEPNKKMHQWSITLKTGLRTQNAQQLSELKATSSALDMAALLLRFWVQPVFLQLYL